MAQKIVLKRSSVAGTTPTTSQLDFGEVAINTADGKIFIRRFVDGTTGNDQILELAPGVAGQSVPGTTQGATSPDSDTAMLGQMWFDTASNALKVWDGTNWTTVSSTKSTSQPSSPTAGQLWYDETSAKMFLYNGTEWVSVGGGAEVTGDGSAPANAQTGDLWYDSDNRTLNVYGGDADFGTGEWVPIKGGAALVEPANPTDGELWYDSDNKAFKVYSPTTQWNAIKGGAEVSIDPPATASTGDLWFDDSDTGRLYVYKDNNWVDAAPGVEPDATTFSVQTITTIADDSEYTLTATSDYMLVVMNGVMLVETTDYAVTGTTLTLTVAPTVGQTLQVYVFDTFAVAGSVSTTENSTINADLSVTGSVTVGTAVSAIETIASATGNISPAFDTHQNFDITLTGNITLANVTTEQVGQSGFFVFRQDGTGGRTLSYSSDFRSAGGTGSITLSTAPNAIDYLPYTVIAENTILLGKPQLAFA